MGLEIATYISDLVPTNPTGGDARSTADDHLRTIKDALKNTFPNVTGAVTASHTSINKVGTTATIGDDSTYPASTAFVQSAIATQSMNGAMAMRVSSTLATSAAVGEHIILTNGSASTVLLPSTPLAGSRVWVSGANGVAGNVLQRNGAVVDGVANDFTIPVRGTVKLRYVSAPVGWVVESDRVNQSWSSIQGKPSTIAGYGITDAGFFNYYDSAQSVLLSPTQHTRVCTNSGQTDCTLPSNPFDGVRIRVLFVNGRFDNRIWVGGGLSLLLGNNIQVGPGSEFVTIDTSPHLIREFVYIGNLGVWEPV